MRSAALVLLVLVAAPAFAQRAAISADLAPSDVANAFESAVIDACAAAVGKGASVASLGLGGRFTATSDPATFQQAGATPGEAVFDVGGAKGVVTIRESGGRCIVSAYGPSAGPALKALAARLSSTGFERMAGQPTPAAFVESLAKTAGGKRIQISLRGSDPGMQGHQSRFSVLTATVFATGG